MHFLEVDNKNPQYFLRSHRFIYYDIHNIIAAIPQGKGSSETVENLLNQQSHIYIKKKCIKSKVLDAY